MSLTYGYELKTNDDELIEAPVELNKILGQLVLPGAVLISHIPFSTGICYAFYLVTIFQWLTAALSKADPFLDSISQLRDNGPEM